MVRTVCEVVVPMPGEVSERVFAVLIGGEETRVCGARAQHHRRHAADRPAGVTQTVTTRNR